MKNIVLFLFSIMIMVGCSNSQAPTVNKKEKAPVFYLLSEYKNKYSNEYKQDDEEKLWWKGIIPLSELTYLEKHVNDIKYTKSTKVDRNIVKSLPLLLNNENLFNKYKVGLNMDKNDLKLIIINNAKTKAILKLGRTTLYGNNEFSYGELILFVSLKDNKLKQYMIDESGGEGVLIN